MNQIKDPRLTNSQIGVFGLCPRRHFYAYILGWRRHVEDAPLRMGSAVHLGLELFANGATHKDVWGAIRKEYDKNIERNPEDTDSYQVEREKVWRLLRGYSWRWSEIDREVRIVENEFEFDMPIVNPETGRTSRTFRIAGKIDKIVELPGNRLAVREHKTTSADITVGSNYWMYKKINSQISLYFIAAIARGYDVVTTEYDVIKKPGIKPKLIIVKDEDRIKIVFNKKTGERVYNNDGKPRLTADPEKGYHYQQVRETPAQYGDRLTRDIEENWSKYFVRQEIPRVQGDLDEYKQDLWDSAKMIGDCFKNNRWPRRTGACESFGKPCPYMHQCCEGFDPEVVPEGFKVVENIHQELEGE